MAKTTKAEDRNMNFLKMVQGLRDEVLVKKTKTKVGEEEIATNSVCVSDESVGFMVASTQLSEVFKGEVFGIKNVKAFLKTYKEYEGKMVEGENDITFTTGKKKITYRKKDSKTIIEIPMPKLDMTGYISVGLTKEDIEAIREGLKNDLSEFVSFIVTPANKLVLKIGGETTYDNIYEQEIKDVERKDKKDKSEIKFLTKLKYFVRIFENLSTDVEDNKVALFLKNDSPFVCVEKNAFTHTKTLVATVIQDDDADEEPENGSEDSENNEEEGD